MGRKNKKNAAASKAVQVKTEVPDIPATQNDSTAVKPKIKNGQQNILTVAEVRKKDVSNTAQKAMPDEKLKEGQSCVQENKKKELNTKEIEAKAVLKKVSTEIRNPEVPITLKDLVSAITKAASDRKKAAGSSKKDSELKEELGSLLRHIKMDHKMMNSPLASEKPLSNEEGLTEIMHLLKAQSDSKKESRSASADTSPITESLLDSTSRAKLFAQGSTDSDSAKDDMGNCSYCESQATTKCTGCRKVFYCNKECQRSHWNAHRDVCRPYKVGNM